MSESVQVSAPAEDGCTSCNHLQPGQPSGVVAAAAPHKGCCATRNPPRRKMSQMRGALSGATRECHPEICDDCGMLVMVGWDDDVCALAAVLDVELVTDPLQEVMCWLAGRHTYTITANRIYRRDPSLAHRSTYCPPVYPDHVCEIQ